jgi:hypothetical protein
MKKNLLFIMLTGLWALSGFSQNKETRVITIPQKGARVEFQTGQNVPVTPQHSNPHMIPLTPGVNWVATDPLAIDYYANVSSQSQNTAAGWGLNNQRLSLYGNSNIPIWEVPFTITAFDERVDMTEDGSRIANGVNYQVQVYEPSSSTPLWTTTISRAVIGIQIRNDGQQVFVAAVNLATMDSSFVYCFNVGQNTPVWVEGFAGNYTAMVLSKSGNRLLLGEYGGVHNQLFVLNPATGVLIFETVYNDQNTPAVSDDGKYIVSGDFSGHVFLLEYNDTSFTYTQRWSYTVSGVNSWVAGMGISGDGTTLAVGTMIFTSTGGYDGELYVFNNYSPVPLWIYPNMGDMVECVDLSYDGSIVAAGGWGPVDNSIPDVFLFRKQSNIPYLTVNSPGSILCLDLTEDGKLCVAGGKAVHSRVFGNGGDLYNINSDPGGGTLGGLAVKSGSSQQAGVRVEIVGMNTYYTLSNDTSAYILKYIPDGTYTVSYSATGYITQQIPGIQIISNQVTTENVTLIPTGNPPTNLTATQGAGLTVVLNWQASTTNGITGYNIYRKQYAFDFYPSTPMGTVGASQLTFTDNTALPLTTYYYAVTGQLSGNLETPYSNDAEGWISTGFVTHEITAWVGTTPTIDGTISPGEWTDACKVDISNFFGMEDNAPRPIGSVTAWFKVDAALTSLYVAVDNTLDTVLNDHDEIALYVDDNHDGVFPPVGDSTEGNFWAAHYATGDVIKFRPIYNTGGVGNVFYLPNPQIKVSAATGHVVYEFVIPLGTTYNWQIGFNSQNQSGIFIFALDDPAGYDGWWPCDNQYIFAPGEYGTITFGGTDGIPPAPLDLRLDNPIAQNIMLRWNMPVMSDFNHFDIYESTNGGSTFAKIDSTIGVQYFLTVPNGFYEFYVTTIDQLGHESSPSNIVQTNVVIGIPEQDKGNDITRIKMGPNPFIQQVTVDFTVLRETHLSIRIFDINGELVNTLYDSGIGDGQHQLRWNGTNYAGNEVPSGVYVVRFYTNNGSPVSFKLVMTR